MGLFDGLISGGFLGFWCVFVGTVLLDSMIPRYIDTMFFMGLKIAELGKYSTWIPSTFKRVTVCPLIPEKYFLKNNG